MNKSKSTSKLNKGQKQNHNLVKSKSLCNLNTKSYKSSVELDTNNNQNNNQNNNLESNNKNFEKFLEYLLTFNKQEEAVRKKLSNSNSTTELAFRINVPLKILNVLCLKTYKLFKDEPNLLQLSAPFYIFGDIHGQYSDLIRFLEMTGLPPNVKLLFLGDYVDRGNNSIEVVALLWCLKIKFPKHVFLIRGNHECSQVNDNYGFLEECVER